MTFRKLREEMGVGFEILAENLEELKETEIPEQIKKEVKRDLKKSRKETPIEGFSLRDHGQEYVLEIEFKIPDTRKGGYKKTDTTERRYSK